MSSVGLFSDSVLGPADLAARVCSPPRQPLFPPQRLKLRTQLVKIHPLRRSVYVWWCAGSIWRCSERETRNVSSAHIGMSAMIAMADRVQSNIRLSYLSFWSSYTSVRRVGSAAQSPSAPRSTRRSGHFEQCRADNSRTTPSHAVRLSPIRTVVHLPITNDFLVSMVRWRPFESPYCFLLGAGHVGILKWS